MSKMFLALLCAAGLASADYTTWGSYRTVTLSTTSLGLSESVENFPLLVRFNAAAHPDMLNDEATQAQEDGSDIRVTLPDGVTDVPFEIEHLSLGEDGALHMWVLVDNVSQSSASAAQFRVYWGKEGETSMSDGSAVFSSDFGYQAVFHLNETEGDVTDVVHGYVGVATGTSTTAGTGAGDGFVSPKSGPVVRSFGNSGGGEDNFTPATDFIRFEPGATDALSTHSGPFTISAWVYSSIVNDGNTAQGTKHIVAHGEGNTGGTTWFARTAALDGGTGQNHYSAGGENNIEGPAAPWGEQHHWQFVTAVYDDGAWTIYRQRENDSWNNPNVPGPQEWVDGQDSVRYKTYTADPPTTGHAPWFIGGASDDLEGDDVSRGWHGWMDEVRISTVARDSNYVKLSFYTMRGDSLGSRLTIGDRESPSAAGPYADWSNRRTITLNTTETGANVAEDVHDFPVLIRLGASEQSIIDAADGGNSIRFTTADDQTSLPYEIDYWSSTSAAIWVLVDVVEGNSNTQSIRMHWGNASATDESNAGAVFGVDNGYVAVFHLGGTDDTTPRPNAVSGGNAATPENFPGDYTARMGIIGAGDSLGGTASGPDAQHLSFGPLPEGTFPDGQGTISLWLKPNAFNPGWASHAVSLGSGTPSHNFWMGRFGNEGQINITGRTANASSEGPILNSPNDAEEGWTVGAWQLVQVSLNAPEMIIYKNGIQVASGEGQHLLDAARTSAFIGRALWPDPVFGGMYDEVRISNVARSVHYAKLSYENQQAVNTLVNIGLPLITVPDPPTNVTGDPANAEATISWTAPANDGGAPITEYKAMVLGDTALACETETTSCTITGLVNGQGYNVVVRAYNSVGASTISSASPAFEPVADPPGAPTAVSGIGGDNQATITWTAPADNGGAPITQYTAMIVGDTEKSCSSATTSCVIEGLVNGESYTAVVEATNMAGTGPLSEPSESFLVEPPVVPDPPTGVAAQIVAGNSSTLIVSWSAPEYDGRSPITGYSVTGTPGGSCTTTGLLTCTVTGLEAATAYTFRVVATNAVGNSDTSEASAAVETPASLLPGSFVIRMDGVNPYSYQIQPAMARVTDRLTMTIHDVYGRRVWSRTILPSTTGVTELTWNGRTSTGAMAAAGMYIVRINAQLKDGTVEATRRGTNLNP